jgi:N-acetylmuramoyl-L-alanine amidase
MGILTILFLIISSLYVARMASADIQRQTIVIDAGHGGQDPGAQFGNINEKDINLDIARRLQRQLSAKGCQVIMTRDEDIDFFLPGYVKGRMAKRTELNQRVEIAARHKTDLFISIHANSFPQRESYGMETYYNEESAAGKALAERIQQQLRTIQPDNQRVAKAGKYYIISQMEIPSVIVEVGFISNARERAMLAEDYYKESIAGAIMGGIEQYLQDFPLGAAEPQASVSTATPFKIVRPDVYRVYYPDESLESLNYEERVSLTWREVSVAQQIQIILNDLLQGPRNTSLVNVFPGSARLLNVRVQNGIAVLDFNHAVRDDFDSGLAGEDLAVRSLLWTVCQLPEIHGLRVLIDGQYADTIAGHVVLDQTLTTQPVQGKAAIVIDDWGINNPGTEQMLGLNIPLTAAVMPHMMFTKQEVESLRQLGLEMILHMPVEAKSGNPDWLGPGGLKTGLSPEELRTRLENGLQEVPYAVGISNHMGSKGTEDANVVQAIIQTAQAHNLFVLDSKTSQNTILEQMARKAGLKTGVRDVFLDNAYDLASIKKQLNLLIATAQKQGKAIGIGHVGPQGEITARAIKEMLPAFEKAGVQIVPLSEILQQP